jgi:hypothetical protein
MYMHLIGDAYSLDRRCLQPVRRTHTGPLYTALYHLPLSHGLQVDIWIFLVFFFFFFFSQQYYAFLNLNNTTIKWLYIDPQRSVAVALQ